MNPTRFTSDQMETQAVPAAPPGFLLFSVAPAQATAESSLQWMYQRMYEEANKASKPAPTRDLFAIMN